MLDFYDKNQKKIEKGKKHRVTIGNPKFYICDRWLFSISIATGFEFYMFYLFLMLIKIQINVYTGMLLFLVRNPTSFDTNPLASSSFQGIKIPQNSGKHSYQELPSQTAKET